MNQEAKTQDRGVTFDDDPRSPTTFNEEVLAEANKMARDKLGISSLEPVPGLEVRAMLPIARIKLLSTQKGILGRVAAAIQSRLDKADEEHSKAERERQKLLAIIDQQEALQLSRKQAEQRKKRAGQISEAIRERIDEMRGMVTPFYIGTQGDGRDVENIIDTYSKIAAAEAALSDFPEIEKFLAADLTKIDAQIAAVEKQHADILRG